MKMAIFEKIRQHWKIEDVEIWQNFKIYSRFDRF